DGYSHERGHARLRQDTAHGRQPIPHAIFDGCRRCGENHAHGTGSKTVRNHFSQTAVLPDESRAQPALRPVLPPAAQKRRPVTATVKPQQREETQDSMTDRTVELERFMCANIPLAAATQMRFVDYGDQRLQISAPLSANGNHHGTAFGGSLYVVALAAGWGL